MERKEDEAFTSQETRSASAHSVSFAWARSTKTKFEFSSTPPSPLLPGVTNPRSGPSGARSINTPEQKSPRAELADTDDQMLHHGLVIKIVL